MEIIKNGKEKIIKFIGLVHSQNAHLQTEKGLAKGTSVNSHNMIELFGLNKSLIYK